MASFLIEGLQEVKLVPFAIATLFLLIASPGIAEPNFDLSESALPCFNPPSETPDFSFAFDVFLNAKGIPVELKLRDGWRPNKEAVRSGVRAIQVCAPYDFAEKNVTFTFDSEQVYSSVSPLDPFK
jgi:hypothetical protein